MTLYIRTDEYHDWLKANPDIQNKLAPECFEPYELIIRNMMAPIGFKPTVVGVGSSVAIRIEPTKNSVINIFMANIPAEKRDDAAVAIGKMLSDMAMLVLSGVVLGYYTNERERAALPVY